MNPERQTILVDHGQEEKYSDRGEEELFLSLPFSDFRGWVYTNDPLYQVTEHISLSRLKNIRSLANLSPIIPGIDLEQQYLTNFDHDRKSHTLLVAAVGNQILSQNNFPPSEIQKFLVAAFLHDNATPAYGDSTKFVDMPNLHEELFWQESVDSEARQYISSLKISDSEIDDIIKNKGILGKILDIADRITYVMQDAYSTPLLNDFMNTNDPQINYLKSQKRYLGNIYQDVMVDQGTVYFKNPSRLYDFLLLRCLLHRDVYLHPINQGRDMLIAETIKPFYSTTNSDSDFLNPRKLRSMTDWNLTEFLAKKNDADPINQFSYLSSWYPQHYEKFSDLNSAESRSEELARNGKNIFGIKECHGFKPGLKYKVLNSKNEILTFADFDPQKSQTLQTIADSTKGFYLYYQD